MKPCGSGFDDRPIPANAFIEKYDHRRAARNCKDFIEYALSGSDYDRGQIETAQAQANNVTEAFARLVDILYQNGALTKQEVYTVSGKTGLDE